MIQELGGDVLAFRVDDGGRGRRARGQGARPPPRGAGQPDRPRPRGRAAPRLDRDRGRRRAPPARPPRDAAARSATLTRRWREGPIEQPAPIRDRGPRLAAGLLGPADAPRGRRHRRARGRSTAIEVARILRTRSDVRRRDRRPRRRPLRGHRPDADRARRPPQPRPLVRRAGRARGTGTPQDRAWLQEAIGVIDAPNVRGERHWRTPASRQPRWRPSVRLTRPRRPPAISA